MKNTLHLEPLGKKINIYVSASYCFGEDAVLLAWFSAPKNKWKLADLCSGCGIIPLLWCRDHHDCQVDAIELQAEAARIARLSASYNNFEGMNIYNQDLRKLPANFYRKYDLVSCNPPYFTHSSGHTSPSLSRRIARSDNDCELEDIIQTASKMLMDKGHFCFSLRSERLVESFILLLKYHLTPKRIQFVQHKENTPSKIVLVEARKNAHSGLLVEPTLLHEQNNKPTFVWQQIYSAFSATH